MILSDNAKNVLEKRYFQPEETTWEDVVNRVAGAIASDASQRSDFYRVIHDMRFLPNSPTLMNSGTGIGMLSACFVLPIEDDMESIFDAVKHAALIHKAGGGTGFNFSHIRAEGSKVGSTGGIASGPISFMKVFNAATDVIKQGGKRRGANMAILNVDHKDIDKFIRCKEDEGQLANFNISVAVTDAFMEKAERVGTPEHQRLLDIAERAWANGEPGLIFIDTVNRNNPTPELGPLEATNPCIAGESEVLVRYGKSIPIGKLYEMQERGEILPAVLAADGKYIENYRVLNKGVRQTVHLTLDNQIYNITLTPDHKVHSPLRCKWVKVEDLVPHELISILPATAMVGLCDEYFAYEVLRITEDAEQEVYDIQLPPRLGFYSHGFFANGIMVHNCGETPLYPYESCNLGSINLAEHVEDGRIDWEKLNETTCIATRFLNNVIDANKYPMPEIEEATKRTRKIGLGVMGWADALIKIGIPYDSEEARDMANEVMRRIRSVAFDESAINSTLTTIAPTGTISIIAGCSSGIEPLFALAYTRKNVLDGKPMKEVHPLFLEEARKLGFYSDELIEHIKEHGSVAGREDVPERVRELFKTAHEISAESHILMQAAFQEYTDNAVSKTINFPHDATVDDVFKAYMLAWKKQCKGITIYRDNSRERQVLNVGVKEEKEEEEAQEVVAPRTRPPTTYGVTEKYKLGCGRSLYVTINEDDDGMCEVFATMGKSGGCMNAWAESLGRMVSMALRSGVDVKSIVKQLTGIRCFAPSWREGVQIYSCSDAIGKAIEEYRYIHAEFTDEVENIMRGSVEGESPECPECGELLTIGEGCLKCESCGYTKCG